MSGSLINWDALKPYDRDQSRSFEELCYQVARKVFDGEGRFTSIDDSGGGDGVEFYLTLPNGDQWGWQAKFYREGRLTSSRKSSIKESLQKACSQHPRLKKWYLCTPRNLTPDEQRWFDEKLALSKLRGEPVVPTREAPALENWSESDFIAWMGEERFSGTRLYFFGELELTLNWFRHQFERQSSAVRHRVEAELHTETQTDFRIHRLLGDAAFRQEVRDRLALLTNEADQLSQAVAALAQCQPSLTDQGINVLPLVQAATALVEQATSFLAAAEAAGHWLEEQRFDLLRATNWPAALDSLTSASEVYESLADAPDLSSITVRDDPADPDPTAALQQSVTRAIQAPRSSSHRLIRTALALVHDVEMFRRQDLHILGDAGIGKTHLACHTCQERLKNQLPAIFIRAADFTTSEPLGSQLRNLLDIPPSYSLHDFFGALASAALARHTRIPILIDGLNEAIHNGMVSDVWRRGLPGLLEDLRTAPDIILITTCRESYYPAIWDEYPAHAIRMTRLDSSELNEIVHKYFDAYRIEADLTAVPLEQFAHPIYLKIFCEAKNPERQNVQQLYIGEQSLFQIFEEYLARCERDVCRRLGLHHSSRILQSSLDRIAKQLWESRTRHLSMSSAVQLIDGKPLDELQWEKSKTRALEGEGLLICRDWSQTEEVLFFPYDLLGGYLIARHLAHSNSEDLAGFLNSPDTETCLFTTDYRTLHPLHEDIRRALAAMLPDRARHYLHDLTKNEIAFGASVDALFEIAPDLIDESAIGLIAELFRDEANRAPLLGRASATFGHASHPLNVIFWHGQLLELSMPERDTSWTEYVRAFSETLGDQLAQFEERFRGSTPVQAGSEERLHLLARYFMWTLTTTVRSLRDQATRALYRYGCRFPQQFFGLLAEAISINDPYIPERMLAAAYGISMARMNDLPALDFRASELPKWSRWLYEQVFGPNAPHSTTHILARDYARRTIDVARLHNPQLLTQDEAIRTQPPYTDGGIRVWGESRDLDKNRYRDGDAPIQMDFENYTLGDLVDDRNNYDYSHPAYQRLVANVYWRVYELGYTLDRFSSIDRIIARMNDDLGRSANGSKVDRYGKKYSWIAYYEIAGYLKDQGLPRRAASDTRTSEIDIDPSFPDLMPVYCLIRGDWLGDAEISTTAWIRDGGVPDVQPILIVDDLMGDIGPWVLLDATVAQEDEARDRNRFTKIRGLLVKNTDAVEVVRLLAQQDVSNRWLPEPTTCSSAYAGEIPWCDTWPVPDWYEMEFVVGMKNIPKVLETSGEENDHATGQLRDDTVQASSERIVPEQDAELGTFGSADDFRDALQALIEENQRRRAMRETVIMPVLLPVQEWSWYETRSAANPSQGAAMPARQLTDALGLVGQPQTLDLFVKDGRAASRVFVYGPDVWHQHKFSYLRKELLDSFLASNDLVLIWVTWGERQHAVKTMAELAARRQDSDAPIWAMFQQVSQYDPRLESRAPKRPARVGRRMAKRPNSKEN